MNDYNFNIIIVRIKAMFITHYVALILCKSVGVHTPTLAIYIHTSLSRRLMKLRPISLRP